MKYLHRSTEIEIPSGVTVDIHSRVVTVKGPRGTVTKNFRHIKADIKKEENKIIVNLYLTTYKQSAILYTLATHIKNMIKGVTVGFRYKMHTVKKHFPIEVAVKPDQVEIGRFLGGRDVKVIKLLPGVTCKKNEKNQDELWFEGVDKETISKVCATCYHSCNVKDKDRRKFLDGIYVSEKGTIEE
ncbi:MAG: 50S ribosomal protein L6 [archaeon]|nr:50S ribosomal protein L6 [archaeon]